MNEEANDADEFIEAAPEDDDFSDYDAHENENPEAVQAMIGGPSWVFPDLVQRVQSSPPSGSVEHANSSGGTSEQHQQQQLQNRSSPSPASDLTASICQPSTSRGLSQPRPLDPPDVSLLSSPVTNSNSLSSSSNQLQQNTIDLCNTVRQSSKLNFSNSYHGSASRNGGGGNNSATSSPPSNSIGSTSSSSGASSLSTNISGLVLTSNSSTSFSSSTHGAPVNSNGVHRSNADNININNDHFPDYNFQSTSSASAQRQLSSLEREIRALEEEKAQLAQQLTRKDDELEEMRQSLSSMRLSSVGTAAPAATANSASTENTIVRRIEDLFEQMSSNLQSTLNSFERRIESLENRQLHAVSNGGNSSMHSSGSPQQLAQLMAEYQRRINESQRQEMCSLFRNILTSAVGEIDAFSTSSSATTTNTSDSLLQQRKNGKFKSNGL